MKEMQNTLIGSFMIINNSITYLKGTARVPSEFWSLVTLGYVGWVRLCLFGELLDEKTCSRYFSTPCFALFPTLLHSQGSISELRNYIIKLHIVIIHQVESTCSPWRTLTCPGGAMFLLKRLRASAMKNVGYGSGTVLLQSSSEYFVWIAPSRFALQKNNLLFI